MQTKPARVRRNWYVYVLYSAAVDKYYRGTTTDLLRRLEQHNSGKGAKYTKGRGPWRLVAVQHTGDTRGSALVAEAALRRLSREQLITWCAEHQYCTKE